MLLRSLQLALQLPVLPSFGQQTLFCEPRLFGLGDTQVSPFMQLPGTEQTPPVVVVPPPMQTPFVQVAPAPHV